MEFRRAVCSPRDPAQPQRFYIAPASARRSTAAAQCATAAPTYRSLPARDAAPSASDQAPSDAFYAKRPFAHDWFCASNNGGSIGLASSTSAGENNISEYTSGTLSLCLSDSAGRSSGATSAGGTTFSAFPEDRSSASREDSELLLLRTLTALEEGRFSSLFDGDIEYFEAAEEAERGEGSSAHFTGSGAGDVFFSPLFHGQPLGGEAEGENSAAQMGANFSKNPHAAQKGAGPVPAARAGRGSGPAAATDQRLHARCFPCPRPRSSGFASSTYRSSGKNLDHSSPSTSATAGGGLSSTTTTTTSTGATSVISRGASLPPLAVPPRAQAPADVTLLEFHEDGASVADEEVGGKDGTLRESSLAVGRYSSHSGATAGANPRAVIGWSASSSSQMPRDVRNCVEEAHEGGGIGGVRRGAAGGGGSGGSPAAQAAAGRALGPVTTAARASEAASAGSPGRGEDAFLHDLEYAIQLSLEMEYRRLSENHPEAVARREADERARAAEAEGLVRSRGARSLRMTEAEFPCVSGQGSGSSEEHELGAGKGARESGGKETHEKDVNCLICFEDYQVGDAVATLHCAGRHCFHKDCITKWLGKSAGECPVCKENVVEESDAGTEHVTPREELETGLAAPGEVEAAGRLVNEGGGEATDAAPV